MMDKLQKFCVISLTQGGRHADNTVDLQEFMIMPTGAENMEQAIRMCAEVYQFLRIILKQKGLSTAVGDEGGFAPDLSDSESVLEVILEAVKKAGYEPGKDISIAIDAAASELYDEERGVYVFPGEGKMKGEEVLRDSGEMIEVALVVEDVIQDFDEVSHSTHLFEVVGGDVSVADEGAQLYEKIHCVNRVEIQVVV